MMSDSFKFGEHDMRKSFGLRVVAFDIILPPKRERKRKIPGRHGQYDYGAKNYEERKIKLECEIERQMTKAQLREVAYALSGKKRLVLWNEPDKYYVGELYREFYVEDFPKELFRTFDLEFMCEPFAYREPVTQPLFTGPNPVSYMGTQEAPAKITLINNTDSTINNITINIVTRR